MSKRSIDDILDDPCITDELTMTFEQVDYLNEMAKALREARDAIETLGYLVNKEHGWTPEGREAYAVLKKWGET